MRKLPVVFISLVVLSLACGGLGEVPVATATASASPGEPASPATAAPVQLAPTAAGETPDAPLSPNATYYVAPPPTGDDGNDGSAGSPWATLQHAVDTVQPGDTILVQSGTYAGARIEQSGTEGAWITLQAAPGAAVLVNTPGPNNAHDSNIEIETWEGDGTVSYWVIAGLEVAGAPSWGIDSRGNDVAKNHHINIIGNIVHDNGLASGRTGIFAAFTDYVLIEGNQSYNNGEHGIYVNNSSDYFTVRGNLLHDNANCGLHMNGDASMGGDGVMSGGLVENNVIYANGVGGGAAINMDGVADTLVRNNLLYDNHATGIAVFQGDGAICSQNNRLLHNTILMPDDGRWGILIADPACINNEVTNNIIYSDHAYRGSINLAGGQPAGFQSDYNVVVDRFTTDDGGTVVSLAEWQALGYDAHSFIATPAELFVNAGGYDFHLPAGSLAVDQGVAAGVTVDLEGNPRPSGGRYDIGAYEYQAGGPAPTESVFLPLIVQTPMPPPAQTGHITFLLGGQVYRLEARQGAAPENISAALDALASGPDTWLNVSPDGNWLLLSTERFDPQCAGWACLALLPADLSSAETVMSGGAVFHPDYSAVASGGNRIVMVDGGGPHSRDLFVMDRQGAEWSSPRLLTAASPYDYNLLPAVSEDGSKLVFTCSSDRTPCKALPFAG
jgi:parallel beta-helix repeat protein